MKTYQSLSSFEQVPGAVITIGTFDGVHTGHQMLIARLKEIARETGGSVVVLTFHPHPRAVLRQGGESVRLLSTLREKTVLLGKYGVDHLIVHPFDTQFSSLPAREFIEQIIYKQLGTKRLVIGYDHRFGRNREGGFEDLVKAGPEFGFVVDKIPEQVINQIAVSSTRIRKALEAGDLETATSFLGRNYEFSGIVIHGSKMGRTLGFPTANLEVETPDKLIPADGVYIINATVGDTRYPALLSIGRRPTIESEGKLSVEVYIIDFNNDIYGEEIHVEMLKRLRGDIKFDSLEALIQQMQSDLADARNYFANNK